MPKRMKAAIVVLDDVLYPASDYHRGACRAAADVIRRFLRIDVLDALMDYYVPGAEELAVVAALSERFANPDDRLVVKIAALMAAHRPRVAPYEDALEVFGILHGMGMPLGLVADGPTLAQRLVIDELGAERVFDQIVVLHYLVGEYPWNDALSVLETMLDCPLAESVLVCAEKRHAVASAERMHSVYRVQRSKKHESVEPLADITDIANLYDLPEDLGWVAVSRDTHPKTSR